MQIARGLLWPASAVYRAGMAGRRAAYGLGALRQHRLGVPVIAVGGLSVGGAGKTPLASWIARYLASAGWRPGVVLRGVGGDEGAVHRRHLPGAVVVEDPNRPRGGRAAVLAGANVVVLDDAYQRFDLARDLNVATIAAESASLTGLLPGGPWREPWTALRRADLIVITRKDASLGLALETARTARSFQPGAPIAVASLPIAGLQRLGRQDRLATSALAGASVIATAGIADPWTFAAQLRTLGASVSLLPWPDHHRYRARDVARLHALARSVDYVVVTEKDAVKLGSFWPPDAPAPLVAELGLVWEVGGTAVETLLSRLMTLS